VKKKLDSRWSKNLLIPPHDGERGCVKEKKTRDDAGGGWTRPEESTEDKQRK